MWLCYYDCWILFVCENRDGYLSLKETSMYTYICYVYKHTIMFTVYSINLYVFGINVSRKGRHIMRCSSCLWSTCTLQDWRRLVLSNLSSCIANCCHEKYRFLSALPIPADQTQENDKDKKKQMRNLMLMMIIIVQHPETLWKDPPQLSSFILQICPKRLKLPYNKSINKQTQHVPQVQGSIMINQPMQRTFHCPSGFLWLVDVVLRLFCNACTWYRGRRTWWTAVCLTNKT